MVKIFIVLLGVYPSIVFSQVNYNEHIKPILTAHCTSCHSQGNIGPMNLDSYEDAASYASMINFVTQHKYMPPFKADYSKISYANERSISENEKKLIKEWIQGGLVKGDSIKESLPNTALLQQTYDTTICMSEAFEHYGIYYDQYQAFVLPLDFNKNKRVKQIDFIPGNKEIVRSAYLSVAEKGSANKMDEWDPRYGYYSYGDLGFDASQAHWYSWMPNTPSLQLRDKEYLFLPSEAELILQLHYGPFGEIQKDSSCITLTFDEDEKVSTQLQNIPFVSTHHLKDSFKLTKGEKKRFISSFYIPEKTKLKSITPLSHLLCKSWEVFAVMPDKTTISLLSIDDWDFHWREKYLFKDYIDLPKNTRIVCTAEYDNSKENPYNPSNPPHTMMQGPHMYDENFLCYFEFAQELLSDQCYLEKPFTIGNKKINELGFKNNSRGKIKITVHNLDDQTENIISEKVYPKGQHRLVTSSFPNKTGRYAISLSKNDKVHDIWFFVNH